MLHFDWSITPITPTGCKHLTKFTVVKLSAAVDALLRLEKSHNTQCTQLTVSLTPTPPISYSVTDTIRFVQPHLHPQCKQGAVHQSDYRHTYLALPSVSVCLRHYQCHLNLVVQVHLRIENVHVSIHSFTVHAHTIHSTMYSGLH